MDWKGCGGKIGTYMALQLLASGPILRHKTLEEKLVEQRERWWVRDVELVGFEIPPNRQPSRDGEEPL